MKKMPKISIVLCAVLACCSLSACTEYHENQGFNEEILAEYKIRELPMPKLENSILVDDMFGRESIYFTATVEEVNALAEQIATYLLDNKEVYNLCELEEGSGGLIGEMLPYYDYTLVDEEFAFIHSGYTFAYSLTPEFSVYGDYLECLSDPIEIMVAFTGESSLKQDWFSAPFDYNARITISKPFGACHIVPDGKYPSGII